MPRIPTISAESQAAALQLPARVPYQGYEELNQVGGNMTQTGSTLVGIGGALRRQQDILDANDMIGQFNGKMKGLSAEAKGGEDPLTWGKEFSKRAAEAQAEIMSTSKSKGAQYHFQQYVARHLPDHVARVDADGHEYMIKKQIAQNEDVLDSISRQAAQAADDIDRKDFVARGTAQINSMVENRLIDPVQGQKERKKWVAKTQYDYMNVLRVSDPDKLIELDKAKAFADVDPGVRETMVARAINERASKVRQEQVEADNAQKDFTESVEREAVTLANEGRLTPEWINMYKPQVTSEKLKLWNNLYEEQQFGVKGNAEVESRFVVDVYNPLLDPTKTMETMVVLKDKKLIGTKRFLEWAPHLQSQINQDRNEQRTIKNEGQTREREVKKEQKTEALARGELAFRTSNNLLEKYNPTLDTLHLQYRKELNDAVNKGEDAVAAGERIMPRLLAQSQIKADSVIGVLRRQLGIDYLDGNKIKQNRTRLGEQEYYRLLKIYDEYTGMVNEKERLRQIDNALKGRK